MENIVLKGVEFFVIGVYKLGLYSYLLVIW